MAKKIVSIFLFALLALVMVWLRVLLGAVSEHTAGIDAAQLKDYPAAIHHFDRAIHWYSPGAGAVLGSIEGLQQIGDMYQSSGDTQNALYAFRILRSALSSVRHVRQPFPDVIQQCNRQIAALMAQSVDPDKGEDFKAEREKRYAQLSAPVGPNTGYALLAEAGFVGWVACAFLFIWLGVGPVKGFAARRAALFAGLFVLCYILWIVGLAKA